jgi:polar amino acid transport system permease protein
MLVGSSDTPRKSLEDSTEQQRPSANLIIRGLYRAPWWLIILGLAWVAVVIAVQNDPQYVQIYSQIQEGISLTLSISFLSYLFSLMIGLVVGLIRSNPPQPPERNAGWRQVVQQTAQAVLYHIVTIYVEFMRGIPALVFLLIAGFVVIPIFREWINTTIVPMLQTLLNDPDIPELVWRGNDPATAIAGLSLVYGAFLSEVFRSGIQSIHKGQLEAAKSLGMSWLQSMRYIVIPQAVRRILPELGNNFISMIKDTSLAMVLAVREVTQIAKTTSGSNFLYRETYMVVSLIYLTLTVTGSLLVQALERALKTETAQTKRPTLWSQFTNWQEKRKRGD